MTRTEIRGTQILDSSVDLAVDVTNYLPIANGGTGATSAAAARTNLGIGSGGEQNVFIQNAAPVGPPSTYLWMQTGLGVNGKDFSLWIEDGTI